MSKHNDKKSACKPPKASNKTPLATTNSHGPALPLTDTPQQIKSVANAPWSKAKNKDGGKAHLQGKK
jgi:hypothetical protein